MFVSDWTQNTYFFCVTSLNRIHGHFHWLSCKFCIMPIDSLKTIDTVGDNDSSARRDEWVPTRKHFFFFFAKHSGSVGVETDIKNECVKQTPTTWETRYVAQRLRSTAATTKPQPCKRMAGWAPSAFLVPVPSEGLLVVTDFNGLVVLLIIRRRVVRAIPALPFVICDQVTAGSPRSTFVRTSDTLVALSTAFPQCLTLTYCCWSGGNARLCREQNQAAFS